MGVVIRLLFNQGSPPPGQDKDGGCRSVGPMGFSAGGPRVPGRVPPGAAQQDGMGLARVEGGLGLGSGVGDSYG